LPRPIFQAVPQGRVFSGNAEQSARLIEHQYVVVHIENGEIWIKRRAIIEKGGHGARHDGSLAERFPLEQPDATESDRSVMEQMAFDPVGRREEYKGGSNA
jgi:hypothetical protein